MKAMEDPMPPDVDQFLARARVAYGPDAKAKGRVRAALIVATTASSATLATKVAAAKVAGATKFGSTILAVVFGGAVASAVIAGVVATSGSGEPQRLGQGPVGRVTHNALQVHAVPTNEPFEFSFAVPFGSESAAPQPSDRPVVDTSLTGMTAKREPKNDELAAELTLIRRAAQALREGRNLDARDALAQHGRSFPRGKLALERRGLDVLVQCASTPGAAAREAAERFLTRAPDSPLARRVREDCLK
jgi:hypothetical protein